MLKPSAIRLAKPNIIAIDEGRPAPIVPETTAKVVTHPSIPPRTASDIVCGFGSFFRRSLIAFG